MKVRLFFFNCKLTTIHILVKVRLLLLLLQVDYHIHSGESQIVFSLNILVKVRLLFFNCKLTTIYILVKKVRLLFFNCKLTTIYILVKVRLLLLLLQVDYHIHSGESQIVIL